MLLPTEGLPNIYLVLLARAIFAKFMTKFGVELSRPQYTTLHVSEELSSWGPSFALRIIFSLHIAAFFLSAHLFFACGKINIQINCACCLYMTQCLDDVSILELNLTWDLLPLPETYSRCSLHSGALAAAVCVCDCYDTHAVLHCLDVALLSTLT